jgi:hypothetical protein
VSKAETGTGKSHCHWTAHSGSSAPSGVADYQMTTQAQANQEPLSPVASLGKPVASLGKGVSAYDDDKGVDLQKVRQRAGHGSPEVTSRYAAILDERDTSLADALEEV